MEKELVREKFYKKNVNDYNNNTESKIKISTTKRKSTSMNQTNISKISTFQAIYKGLRSIPRICSIVVKLSALFFAILYLVSGPQVPPIWFIIAVLPTYFLVCHIIAYPVGFVVKFFLVHRYMFWALERVDDVGSWYREARDHQIIWLQ